MTDILAALLAAASESPADPADLAALADAMADASADDRLAVLRGLVDAAGRTAAFRTSITLRLESNPAGKRISKSCAIRPDYGADKEPHIARSLRQNIAEALSKSVEDDHWYVVRFRSVRRHLNRELGRPFDIIDLACEADIVPLDGGKIAD